MGLMKFIDKTDKKKKVNLCTFMFVCVLSTSCFKLKFKSLENSVPVFCHHCAAEFWRDFKVNLVNWGLATEKTKGGLYVIEERLKKWSTHIHRYMQREANTSVLEEAAVAPA